jgi:selenocysteine-specific elongation factor
VAVVATTPLTLGTAGHIDHGKTALIGALTGKNTDRLSLEREKGISIELGYAELELPSHRAVSLVDVPGHERFVRTMVAGASGIDFYLLCVAADDGVMPQTLEHLIVLRQLGIDLGVVCVTKSDLTDPEPAREEIAEFVGDAECVCVSAVTGAGIEDLLVAIERVADKVSPRLNHDQTQARLHVDRSFTLRGIGTVVTGTLWEGAVEAGESVKILPRGLEARVRSVQVHDRFVERALAGQRVALNLSGIRWRSIARGDVVVSKESQLVPSYLLDAAITLELDTRQLKRGARVQVHHGTSDSSARLVSLESDELKPKQRTYAQLRLDRPVVARSGDRLILRQLAPPDTIGGGTIVDATPRKHGVRTDVVSRLCALERGEEPDKRLKPQPTTPPRRRGPTEPDADAQRLAELLADDGPSPRTDQALAQELGLTPSQVSKKLAELVASERIVRVSSNLCFDPAALKELCDAVIGICRRDGAATIASVRDELGTSRKYAQALLEYLDSSKVTLRQGDTHTLRRQYRS